MRKYEKKKSEIFSCEIESRCVGLSRLKKRVLYMVYIKKKSDRYVIYHVRKDRKKEMSKKGHK